MQIGNLSEIMKKYGIVGAGGAGFPSYAKLSDKADTVILNCAECEPLLKLHRQLMEKFPYEIMSALSLVAKAVGAKNIHIAVKKSYKNAIEAIKANQDSFKDIKLNLLPDAYPSGDEIVMIYEVTKRVVDPGAIPISKGVIVYNVETMLNLYNAVNNDAPVTDKYVTIAGEVKNPVTLKVPIGTAIGELIAAAGGETSDDVSYINGGPMMGKLCSKYDVVTKTTNAILVLKSNNIVVAKKKSKTSINMKRAMASCCQCRSCTDLCPRFLLGHPIEPHQFMRSASSGDTQNTTALVNTMFCSSCGLCELFSCPQGLSPRTLITEYKTKLRQAGVAMPKVNADEVFKDRDYRRAPMSRLVQRLGLKKYNVTAPISELQPNTRAVKILLSQHIGAPCTALVKKGDEVTKGQLIGKSDETKLGSVIHSSVDGKVVEVNDKFIIIMKKQ